MGETYHYHGRISAIGSAVLLGATIAALALGHFLAGPTDEARASEPGDPFHIVEVEQEHAWCYVLINDTRHIGELNVLACVLKRP